VSDGAQDPERPELETPGKHKRVEMPKSSFDKKGFTKLKEHDYLISIERDPAQDHLLR
jgi:hypothetical protein